MRSISKKASRRYAAEPEVRGRYHEGSKCEAFLKKLSDDMPPNRR